VYILIIRLAILIVALVVLLIITQDIQIFPRAIVPSRNNSIVPKDVTSSYVATDDGKSLEAWFLPAVGSKRSLSVILFHGNGDDLESVYPVQQWLSALGYSSLSFDYRGYRNSSGWPSERGLYLDSEAIWRFAETKLGFSADRTILFGTSIGSGPASYLAAKVQPNYLVLISPLRSLKYLVSKRPLLRFLTPFLWYEFPVASNVGKLKNTSLLVVHGVQDGIIPFEQGKKTFSSYQGQGESNFIELEFAGHNDALSQATEQIALELAKVEATPN